VNTGAADGVNTGALDGATEGSLTGAAEGAMVGANEVSDEMPVIETVALQVEVKKHPILKVICG